MRINVTYIESVDELIFGTVDGHKYGTSYIAQAEATDEDNIYPH